MLSYFLLAEAAIPYAVQLLVVAIGIGLSYAAQVLTKQKAKSSPVQLDNEPTATSTRGSTLPYLIGRRRLGAIFAWVGRRNSFSASVHSGGGKSRGRKTHGFSDQIVYTETGVHMICVGPAKKLHRIFQDGKQVWPLDSEGKPTEAPIDSTGHPSGSGFSLQNGQDSFVIYWGEHNQPIDPIVQAAPPLGMGVATRFPYCCYIRWQKFLGITPRWPLLEYEIETEIQHTEITSSPSAINLGGSRNGVNAAHALTQLLCAPFPYGIDQTFSDTFDSECLQQVAETLAADMPCSIFAPNAQTVQATVGAIMQDAGLFLSWDPNIGKYKFRPIRPDISPQTLDAALILAPKTQVDVIAYAKPVDKLIFAFADIDHAFKTSTIAFDDDSQAIYQNYERAQQTEMPTVVSFLVALTVAERRSQEMLARHTSYTIHASRGARRLFPGLGLFVPSVTDDLLRILEVALDTETGDVKLSCVTDFYGTSYARPSTATAPTGGAVSYTVDQDVAFAILEIPAHVLQGQPQTIVVPRIRGSGNMTAAELYISGDDTTYTDEGKETSVQTGGALTSGMDATDSFYQAQGPTFDAEGPDIASVLDLSTDELSWGSGKQVALIGDELFFLQKVTALGGSSFRLDGLMRARYDTVRATHAIGAKVYIFQLGQILDIQDPLLKPGVLLYAKPDPTGFGGTVDLATITPASRTLVGKGVVPMTPTALRTIDPRSTFRTTEDVDLKWGYRSTQFAGTGAGMQGAGAKCGVSAMQGYFEVRFFDLGMVEKAAYISTLPNFTYGNDAIVADFGSEQSFIVQVRNVNGGWKSDYVQLEVDLV